mgnify:CR=1 FL=1
MRKLIVAFLAILAISTAACIKPSRSITRARGPITPAPKLEQTITRNDGAMEIVPPGPAGMRYGKFKNVSLATSFHVELTPEFQECQNCDPWTKPDPNDPRLIWKTKELLTLSINSVSSWYRVRGDQVYRLRYGYIWGRHQYFDRTELDPVFSVSGTMCAGAQTDWCYWFNK